MALLHAKLLVFERPDRPGVELGPGMVLLGVKLEVLAPVVTPAEDLAAALGLTRRPDAGTLLVGSGLQVWSALRSDVHGQGLQE